MIAIIDYGMGNLASVKNAFTSLGFACKITSDREEILSADKAVLPGVGAFKDAMQQLQSLHLIEVIREFVDSKKPLLGICLGMQLLFEKSYEYGETKGLCLLKGEIVHFGNIRLKVPHMGWNNLTIDSNSKLFKGLDNPYVYFVHSYHLVTKANYVNATTNYGYDFIAAVENDNLFAVQFHPEKSGEVGLKILKNFGDMIC